MSRSFAGLALLLAGSAALAQPAATRPTTAQAHVIDTDLKWEMEALIPWLEGTDEQKAIAENALRMVPAEALPHLKSALDKHTLGAEAEKHLRVIYDAQVASRKRMADDADDHLRVHQEWALTYGKAGVKDPAWDTDADRLVRIQYAEEASEDVQEALIARLTAAHCRDPLIQYLCLTDKQRSLPMADRIDLFSRIAASKYPAGLRLLTLAIFSWEVKDLTITPEQRAEIRRQIDRVIPLLTEARAEKTPIDYLATSVHQMIEAGRGESTPLEYWLTIQPGVEAALPESSVSPWIDSEIHHNAGWAVRGSGFADTVKPADWATSIRYLRRAADSANKAIAIDGSNAHLSRQILGDMCMLGTPPEERIAEFHRCLEMNPNNPETIETMASRLMQRWTGDPNFQQQLTQLAHASILSRNYEAHMPQTCLDTYQFLAWDLDPKTKKPFMRTPEVKADFAYAYDTAMHLNPDQYTINCATTAFFFCLDIPRAKRFLALFPEGQHPDTNFWNEKNWAEHKAYFQAQKEPTQIPPTRRPKWMP